MASRSLRPGRVPVNLDSDRSMKLGPGGYIAVDDAHLDGIPTHEQDFSREALILTSYPGG